jgi:hypothetical protein
MVMTDILKFLLIAVAAWAVETVCCAVAYRIHRGQKGLGITVRELWQKAIVVGLIFAAVGMAGLLIGTEYDLGNRKWLMVYVQLAMIPIGAQIINWIYGLDDWTAGVGVYFLRIIPGIVVIIPMLIIR